MTSSGGWKLDHSYAGLPSAFFVAIAPVPVAAPSLAVLNEDLARDLGLDPDRLSSPDGIAVLAGNALPPGARPLAQAYAGHQYGHFTMLGDGRAILLGEQIDPRGERRDLQYKGSGRTPFSRDGDGRAALGPMLREYLVSEALHALGIPTTRSLSVVATGETVLRPTGPQPGAILIRVAASHIRVGTFEYAAATGEISLLEALADHTIARHYPAAADSPRPALALLEAVIAAQAELIARWMLVGFIHGVMNTDNMAISGETIDFGPCAFMDAHDPKTVFSSIDRHGRYAYGNQPAIALWNLERLAIALLPLLGDDEASARAAAVATLEQFRPRYQASFIAGMRKKLGVVGDESADEGLIEELLAAMTAHHLDHTNTFLDLAAALDDAKGPAPRGLEDWIPRWHARLSRQEGGAAAGRDLMSATNPRVTPRNHHVEAVLIAFEKGDREPWEDFLAALRSPFADHPLHARYRDPAPAGFATGYRTFCGT